MLVSLNVNGRMHVVSAAEGEFLIDTIRGIGLKGTKRGCDTTSCGLCNVIIDGKLVPSCSYLTLRAEGKDIVTIEGTGDLGRKIAEYIADEGVEQCGYCSPGFVMTVYAMLSEKRELTDDEIKHYLAGSMCRCSGYEGQHRAIRRLLEDLR